MPDFAWLLIGLCAFLVAVPARDRLEKALRKFDSAVEKRFSYEPATMRQTNGAADDHA